MPSDERQVAELALSRAWLRMLPAEEFVDAARQMLEVADDFEMARVDILAEVIEPPVDACLDAVDSAQEQFGDGPHQRGHQYELAGQHAGDREQVPRGHTTLMMPELQACSYSGEAH